MKLLFSDQQIINALKSADDHEMDKAFRYLYNNHYHMALQFVKSNSGSDYDAEDTFQDVLIGLYQNIRKGVFRGESAIKTYLYAMIRNQWLVKLKKNKRNVIMEIPDSDGFMQVVPDENPPETLQVMVGEILEQVGERCREILKFYYFDNLSMSEIAERAEFDNENSAKTQKYKCMQRLIKIMADRPELKKAMYELLAANE